VFNTSNLIALILLRAKYQATDKLLAQKNNFRVFIMPYIVNVCLLIHWRHILNIRSHDMHVERLNSCCFTSWLFYLLLGLLISFCRMKELQCWIKLNWWDSFAKARDTLRAIPRCNKITSKSFLPYLHSTLSCFENQQKQFICYSKHDSKRGETFWNLVSITGKWGCVLSLSQLVCLELWAV